MSKIRIATLVFMLGFAIAIVVTLGKKVDWQWLLLFPAAIIALFAYRRFSEEQLHNTKLIGTKGGRSHRNAELEEYDDEEE